MVFSSDFSVITIIKVSDGIQLSTPGCLTIIFMLILYFPEFSASKGSFPSGAELGRDGGREEARSGTAVARPAEAPQLDHRDPAYALDHKIVPAPVMGIRGEATALRVPANM